MSCDEQPEISVVVPVYNEEANIAAFLAGLARQREVRIEVIFSDGGSSDQGVASIAAGAGEVPFPVAVVQGAKGRGRQMNRGAELARAAMLLFLHIDSSFPDPFSFRKAIDSLSTATRTGNGRVAGHFALQFDFDTQPPLPYRYYAAKATLDRPGCTHGDQGLMIGSRFFRDLGCFDPALPVMEDTFLAEKIRKTGGLLLLPAQIRTSPRRFLAEGLLPRQTLNAILMNLAHIGRLDLLESVAESYPTQDAAGKLSLAPFLSALKVRIAGLPQEERRRLWYETGKYVRANAWQIPFLLDVVIGRGGEGEGGSFLALHDRFLGRLIDNRGGDLVTALLVRGWFVVARRSAMRRR